jgi:hypothetical protein
LVGSFNSPTISGNGSCCTPPKVCLPGIWVNLIYYSEIITHPHATSPIISVWVNPCRANEAMWESSPCSGSGTPGALGSPASRRPPRKAISGPPLANGFQQTDNTMHRNAPAFYGNDGCESDRVRDWRSSVGEWRFRLLN